MWTEPSAWNERLMADKHPLTEGLPCEMFGRCETPTMEEMAFVVNYVGVTVYDSNAGCIKVVEDILERVFIMEGIACIKETDEGTLCEPESFIECIIESGIGFALDDDIAAWIVLTICFGKGDCRVG